jgi:hypothetical protein
MAVKLADAVTYLTTDDSELKKGMGSAEKQIESGGNRFGSILQGVGVSIGMGVAGIVASAATQVVSFLGDSIGAASDMGETVSKTNVLFGESADSLLAWSETAAGALGQSKQQALDAATTFATFGKAAGLTGDDLVQFSTGFTGLASDLASFNNTSPEQAIEAIGAALRGEAEPLRAYGVLLDDASMRQKALEMGIISTTKEALTPQQKVLAAQALIYEQTSAAQGDFARTSGGLANQQRILDAQMANLKTTVGEALLPVMLSFTSLLNRLVTEVLPPVTSFIREQVVPWMTKMGEAIGGMVGVAQQWFGKFSQSVDTGAIRPLNFFNSWIQQNMPRIQQIVQTVLQAIQGFWDEHGERIMSVVNTLLGWLTMFWETQFRTILNIVQVALQLLTGDFEGAGNTLRTILNDWRLFFETVIKGIVNGIRQWFSEVDWGAIGRGIIDGIANGIRSGAGAIADAARRAAEDALNAAKRLLGINSPSKVAADEIGEPFAEGIGAGIRASLGDMASGVNMGLNSLMSGIRTPTAGGAGAGAISITVNVSGGGDPVATGLATRNGVLSALRAAGIR